MIFHFLTRKTISTTTKHERTIVMGNQICGLRMDNARPHEVVFNEEDFKGLLRMPETQLIQYLIVIRAALAKGE